MLPIAHCPDEHATARGSAFQSRPSASLCIPAEPHPYLSPFHPIIIHHRHVSSLDLSRLSSPILETTHRFWSCHATHPKYLPGLSCLEARGATLQSPGKWSLGFCNPMRSMLAFGLPSSHGHGSSWTACKAPCLSRQKHARTIFQGHRH